MSRRALYLHEEVLLLALRDVEGTAHPGVWAQAAVGGALLGEFLLGGQVRMVREGAEDLVEVSGDTAGDDLLDDCLAEIRESRQRRPAQFWAGLFATRGALLPKTAEGLCRLGMLRADEKQVLLIFKRKTYPELDPLPEAALVERLRAAILGDGDVEPRSAYLIAVAQQTGLLKAHFGERELSQRKGRIDDIVRGNLAGDATGDAARAASAFFFITMMAR